MATKEWYNRNKSDPVFRNRIKTNTRNWQLKNPQKYMWGRSRTSAMRYNIPFDIEPEDIIIPEYCPVLKVKMKIGTRYTPSVDRIFPALGYTKGNIQVISMLANAMKSNATPEELIKFSEWVMKTYKNILDK